jgi:heme-degrading monooxygenase HmoA
MAIRRLKGHRLRKVVPMFARSISVHLKPNTLASFNRKLEREILPLLRQQKGFKDEITLAEPQADQVLSISLWENQLDADAYAATLYPQVLEILRAEIDGHPHVRTFSVVTSSVNKQLTSL